MASEQRCKTCRWWGRPGEEGAIWAESLYRDGRQRICILMSVRDHDEDAKHPWKAAWQKGETIGLYGSEDDVSLSTQENFGCVQWEATDGE